MKPDFSNTRTDAGLLAKTSPEIRWSGKLSKQESVTAVTASVMIPRPQNSSPYQYNPLPLYADTRRGVNTDPADGRTLNLNAKFHAGCSAIVRCKNSCASWIVYGCGKRSRTASQILRLFAWLATDWPSSSRHGRTVHRSSTSCIDYSLLNLIPVFCTSR